MTWKPKPYRTQYTSSQWAKWRKQVFQTHGTTCQLQHPGCTHMATEADHIKPLYLGGAPLDINNGQPLCHNCHTIKTQTEAANARARNPLHRPPEPHPGILPPK